MEYFKLFPEQAKWVETTAAKMTLREKIGQLFCLYISDELFPQEQINEYHHRIATEIKEYAPGGYYLNRYYIPTSCYLIDLMQQNSKIPLFICSDMESGAGGGFGGQIAYGLTRFPSPMGVSATGSEHYAFNMGYHTAYQAELIGVNFIFAPVLDINNNANNPIINIRSFGETPEMVSKMGVAYLSGLQTSGVLGCAKHFPGHGNTEIDTHLELATIKSPINTLESNEFIPFQHSIENGILAMMPGHLVVPALDDENNPASMSYKILTELLREKWNYKGLIVTDALLMGAITHNYQPGEAAVQAFQAGADILLMPPDFPKAFDALFQAVESGEITEKRVDESVKRILAAKAEIELPDYKGFDEENIVEIKENHTPDHYSLNMCRDAVTLLRNKNLLPIEVDEPLSLILMTDSTNPHSFPDDSLFQYIGRQNPHTLYTLLGPDSEEDDFAHAYRCVQQMEVVILALDINVLPEKGSVDILPNFDTFIQSALATHENIIVIAYGNPYLLKRFNDYRAFLCAYGYFDLMNQAVTEILFGERIPHGRLPVTIPDYAQAGDGLSF